MKALLISRHWYFVIAQVAIILSADLAPSLTSPCPISHYFLLGGIHSLHCIKQLHCISKIVFFFNILVSQITNISFFCIYIYIFYIFYHLQFKQLLAESLPIIYPRANSHWNTFKINKHFSIFKSLKLSIPILVIHLWRKIQ